MFSTEGDFIKWNPKFKVGIPVIDQQHETLVKLCNDFYQSLLQNNKSSDYKKIVKSTLETCLNYADTHFKEEEKLMKAAKFDGLNEHKHSHARFTNTVSITYEGIENLPVSEAIKFAHFLHDWIFTHIAHEDRLYLPALKEFLLRNSSKFIKEGGS